MKKNDLTKGLFATLLLASPLVGAEPQYPPEFKPQILFQDSDYIAKHSRLTPPPASTEQAKPAAETVKQSQPVTAPAAIPAPAKETTETQAEKPASAKDDPLTQNYPIGVIVIALAGFIFWSSRQPGSKAQQASSPSAAVLSGTVGGETGVAKYLKSLEASSVEKTVAQTGVAKYLKGLETTKTAAPVAAPAPVATAAPAPAPASVETGVAKYLKRLELSA